MPYSNWFKYGYRLTPKSAGDIEIRKSKIGRSCFGMARIATDEDWIGGVTSWDFVGQPTTTNCKNISPGDIYLVQSTHEQDTTEIYVRECCTTCAISYGFIEKTR